MPFVSAFTKENHNYITPVHFIIYVIVFLPDDGRHKLPKHVVEHRWMHGVWSVVFILMIKQTLLCIAQPLPDLSPGCRPPTEHKLRLVCRTPQALRQPWSCRMLPRTMTMFRIALVTTDWMYTRRFSGMKAEHMMYFNTINEQLISQKSLLELLLLTIISLQLSRSPKRRILNQMWTRLIFRKVMHHLFLKN
jgi:hypothetical protein